MINQIYVGTYKNVRDWFGYEVYRIDNGQFVSIHKQGGIPARLRRSQCRLQVARGDAKGDAKGVVELETSTGG